eukprot:gene1673-15691_t
MGAGSSIDGTDGSTAAAIQAAITTVPGLPRATKVKGRFICAEADFPGYPNDSGLKDVWKWQRAVAKDTKGKAFQINKPMGLTMEEVEKRLPVIMPDITKLECPPAGRIQATWLGHASILVQLDGWNILADPIFSERCSPVGQWIGPKRVRPCPVDKAKLAEQLPRIDAVVISHNHLDHLDKLSVIALASSLRPAPVWFVAKGTKQFFRSHGVANVVEMDWSESATFTVAAANAAVNATNAGSAAAAANAGSDIAGSSSVIEGGRAGGGGGQTKTDDLVVTCCPVQHWCQRGLNDKNKSLWAGWSCATKNASYFFGGDTGYCPMFKRVGNALGPFDLAAIPIAAYGSEVERYFHKPNHMNPEEAVKTHLDLKSQQSVHWGTFQLTQEPLLEPPQRLAAAVQDEGLEEGAFVVLGHGETRDWPVMTAPDRLKISTETANTSSGNGKGAGGKMPSPSELRWGILGSGKICNDFANALKAVGYPIAAVAASSADRAAIFAKSFGIPA